MNIIQKKAGNQTKTFLLLYCTMSINPKRYCNITALNLEEKAVIVHFVTYTLVLMILKMYFTIKLKKRATIINIVTQKKEKSNKYNSYLHIGGSTYVDKNPSFSRIYFS